MVKRERSTHRDHSPGTKVPKFNEEDMAEAIQRLDTKKVLGIRVVETILMSLIAGGFSSYVALKIIETKIDYMEKNVNQLAGDIRDIRNFVINR